MMIKNLPETDRKDIERKAKALDRALSKTEGEPNVSAALRDSVLELRSQFVELLNTHDVPVEDETHDALFARLTTFTNRIREPEAGKRKFPATKERRMGADTGPNLRFAKD